MIDSLVFGIVCLLFVLSNIALLFLVYLIGALAVEAWRSYKPERDFPHPGIPAGFSRQCWTLVSGVCRALWFRRRWPKIYFRREFWPHSKTIHCGDRSTICHNYFNGELRAECHGPYVEAHTNDPPAVIVGCRFGEWFLYIGPKEDFANCKAEEVLR